MNKKKNPHFRIRLEWNPGDIFMGVYVRGPRLDLDLEPGSNNYYWNVWICLIPCLPIHIWWMPLKYKTWLMWLFNFGPKSSVPICKCGREMVLEPVVDFVHATSGTVCSHGYPYQECVHHKGDSTRAGDNCEDLRGPYADG